MFSINQGEPSKHSQMFLINQGEPCHRHRLPRGDHLLGRHELERRQSCSKTRSDEVGEEQRRVFWKKEEGCRRSGISPIKIWKSRLPRPRGCQRFGKLLTRSNGCEYPLWRPQLCLNMSSGGQLRKAPNHIFICPNSSIYSVVSDGGHTTEQLWTLHDPINDSVADLMTDPMTNTMIDQLNDQLNPLLTP